ncbi:MAG: hypothetical protein P4L41_00965 [Flavipsychrobacter sp.]|nr:hypothetical protein [Flavipsychrobacter sp.]
MKKLFVFLIAGSALAGCSGNSGSYTPPQQNNVTIENNTTAGFDVSKLAPFVKTSTDPATLEKAINDPNNHINDLDLDKDGNVDYVKVVEKANNKLDIVDDVSKDQSVTVASINIQPAADNRTADMQIQGNPTYVSQPYYHSSFTFTDFLLLSYFLRPHPYYMPMYHYGYYPSYYRPYRTTVTRTYRTTNNNYGSSNNTYNRKSLSNPGSSQRSFQERSPSSGTRSGGFGRGSSGSSRSFGSGRSGFGSGRSGFGRRR